MFYKYDKKNLDNLKNKLKVLTKTLQGEQAKQTQQRSLQKQNNSLSKQINSLHQEVNYFH